MPRHPSKTLTELEHAIMRVVWAAGGSPVAVETIQRELEEAGHPLAPPSVRTMLTILMKKGYLSREQDGRRHLYQATVPEEEAQQGIAKDVVERAFDGSAADLVAALVRSNTVRREDVERVRKMLDQLEE